MIMHYWNFAGCILSRHCCSWIEFRSSPCSETFVFSAKMYLWSYLYPFAFVPALSYEVWQWGFFGGYLPEVLNIVLEIQEVYFYFYFFTVSLLSKLYNLKFYSHLLVTTGVCLVLLILPYSIDISSDTSYRLTLGAQKGRSPTVYL